MARLAVFVTVTLGMLTFNQVHAGISKEDCERIYGVKNETWYSIKAMKEKSTSKPSTDNCALDGDELLTQYHKELLGDIRRSWVGLPGHGHRAKRKAMVFELFHPTAKWDVRRITFYIDPEFADAEEDTILTALDYFSSITCFDFERGSVPDDVLLSFVKDRSCLTFMGKVPDEDLPHKIFLNADCTDMAGEIVHQMGHMIGLWHEHQRPDRDEYVKVQFENFKEGETGNHAVFEKHVETHDLPYDYGSIMHFGPANSVKDTDGDEVLFTMVSATEDPVVALYHRRTMGQRAEASFWDKKVINLEYCAASCPPNPQSCQNNGFRDPRDCSTCVCPDGYGGNTCNRRGVYNSEARCGGQLRANSDVKELTSPGYDRDTPYEVGVTCSWSITTTPENRLKLTFVDDFGVYCRGKEETCYHWVEIRTGDDLTMPGIRFCCEGTPELTLTSTSNEVLVIFKSQHPAADSERRGFKLTYAAVDDCATTPCENGGSCRVDEDEDSGFRCICTDGFEGITCSERVDACPCQNGGTCSRSADGTVECDCTENFEGEMCEYGCGTCEMPERTYDKQDAVPCDGYRVAQKEVCEEKTVSYRTGWWRRRTRYKTVTVCHLEDDPGVGPYCGCDWELYENKDGEMACAMVGYGEWGECECYHRKCRQARQYHKVLGGRWWYYYWCADRYTTMWKEYRDCPADMSCDEDCGGRCKGWWWRC